VIPDEARVALSRAGTPRKCGVLERQRALRPLVMGRYEWKSAG